jgi:hypothetical protein
MTLMLKLLEVNVIMWNKRSQDKTLQCDCKMVSQQPLQPSMRWMANYSGRNKGQLECFSESSDGLKSHE